MHNRLSGHANRHLNVRKWSEHVVFLTFWLGNVLRATATCTFSTSQLPKVVRDCQFLTLLTSKCASRRNGVRFFVISTSKSAPKLTWFVHLDFEMCFAPQRRALFRHLNFQKWSENGVFYAFWLRNVLRATTACNFSSLIWPDVSAPAALASLLFNFPGPQIIGKNVVNRDISTFLRSCIFFLLTLSLLSDPFHICFPSVHIVGSLTSKLPSINIHSRSRDRDVIKNPHGHFVHQSPIFRYHTHFQSILGFHSLSTLPSDDYDDDDNNK